MYESKANLDSHWCWLTVYDGFLEQEYLILYHLLSTVHLILWTEICATGTYFDLPPMFIIHDGLEHSASEEGFINTSVKIATGLSNTKLCDLFGEPNHQWISDMYYFTVAYWIPKKKGFYMGRFVWCSDIPFSTFC